MSYSRGVLIHNFNEDQFGIDLHNVQRPPQAPMATVSHTVHNWKAPVANEVETAASQHVERYILFGHTGDMRDPHTNLQKTEFATASQYFLQDPKLVSSAGRTLTADGFAISDDPTRVKTIQSHIATKKKMGWGDMRQSHSLPPGDRFMTEHKRAFQAAQATEAEKQDVRYARPYDEFTKGYDSVNTTRSTAPGRGGGLRTAAQLMVR